MSQPPPIPPEILLKIAEANLPPPAPLLPRALAFIADGILATLLALLAIHWLIPVCVPEDFPVFLQSAETLWNAYREANLSLAQGNRQAMETFSQILFEQTQQEAFQNSITFLNLTAMLTSLAYFILSETLTHGASFGKKIFRLRVISTFTGEPPRLLQTVSRSLWRACTVAPAGILILIVVTINAHVPFFTYRRRAWHDKLARTDVIDDR